MASRKRKPDSPQIGLSFGGPGPSSTIESEADAVSFDLASQSTREPAPLTADLGPMHIPMASDVLVPTTGPSAEMATAAILGIMPPRVHQEIDLESFDDYDDSQTIEDIPRLRLVDPPRQVAIIVEAVGEAFEVCRLRDNGTTVASVMYTRKELLELVSRAQAALEM